MEQMRLTRSWQLLSFSTLFLVAASACGVDASTHPPPAQIGETGSSGGSGAGDGGGDGTIDGGDASSTPGDRMALVPANSAFSLPEFWIDSYEASLSGTKASSVANVAPAVNIDFTGAKNACAAAGKRLCTLHEWKVACRGPKDLKFAFQADDTKLIDKCDVARTTNNTPGSLPSKTNAHPQCQTDGAELWDMIGNLTEWTTSDADQSAIAAGAAFYQPTAGSNCDATLNKDGTGTAPMPPTEKATDIGFRCCRTK